MPKQYFRKAILPILTLSATYLSLIQSAHGLPNSNTEIDKFKHSWTFATLKLQREMDLHTPLNKATFIGTHNSYNSASYQSLVRYVDPNQKLSLYDQLEMGIRSIELDTHWTLNDHFSKDILLCHGQSNHLGCGIFDRKVREGLEEIRHWLENNPNEIILIYIERHLDGHEPRLAAELDKYLGQYIFKPTVVRDKNKNPKGCVSLPGTITKADVLKTGKQVLIVTKQCDRDVQYEEQDNFPQIWNNIVFAGIGQIPKNEFDFLDSTITDFTHFPDCGWSTIFHRDTYHSSIWRIFEDRTILSGVLSPGKKIEGNDMKELMQCGINWPTLDMLTIADPRLNAAIWSWAKDYPANGKGNCAIYVKGEGIENVPCTQINIGYACQDEKTKQIKAIINAGSWQDGESMCQRAAGLTWHFTTPVNGKQMNSLKETVQLNGLNQAWLNYSLNKEGIWESNLS